MRKSVSSEYTVTHAVEIELLYLSISSPGVGAF